MRRTFYLLGCEGCGHFAPPPPPINSHIHAEPLRCAECRELLLLIECWLADETQMWQAKPGSQWYHVAYANALPASQGRMLPIGGR